MPDKPSYTPACREVIVLAKQEAGRLGHQSIEPEHFMLGIIRKGDGLAIKSLTEFGVSGEELKGEIEEHLGSGEGPVIGLILPSKRSKDLLDMAKEIAGDLKHGWCGTEHLLLALAGEKKGFVREFFEKKKIDYKRAKEVVLAVIGGVSAAPREASLIRGFEKSIGPGGDLEDVVIKELFSVLSQVRGDKKLILAAFRALRQHQPGIFDRAVSTFSTITLLLQEIDGEPAEE